MPNQKSELALGSHEALKTNELRWETMDKFIPPENREYEEISAKARAALGRWRMALDMPNGWPIVQRSMEELSELYGRAMQIRGETAHGNVGKAMRASLGLQPNQPVLSSLEARIDQLHDRPMLAPIADDLKKIVTGLDQNPKEFIGQRGGLKNTFYDQRGASLIPNFDKVAKARDIIKKIRESPTMAFHPEIKPTLDAGEAGIVQTESANPQLTQLHRWQTDVIQGVLQPNYFGVRVFFGITGALISGIGAGYCLLAGKPFTWPIAAWGGLSAYCANPNLLAGRFDKSIERLSTVFNKDSFALMNKSFRGNTGVKAFDALQDIAQNRWPDMKALLSQQNPSMAQIGAVAGDPGAPLMKILSGLSPEKRTLALNTFGQRRTSEEREALRDFMIARDKLT